MNKFIRLLERAEKEPPKKQEFNSFDDWWHKYGCQEFNRNLIEIITDPIGNVPIENLLDIPSNLTYTKQDIINCYKDADCSCDLVSIGDDLYVNIKGY